MSTEHKHRLIVIPGLGDDKRIQTQFLEYALGSWKKHGIYPEIFLMDWHNQNESFQQKIDKLLQLIDGYIKKKDTVSVMGMSAGASAALNAFIERKSVLSKGISSIGRLRKGNITGFRSLEARSTHSPSFRESVTVFERKENDLTPSDRQRIMTVSALFDELVPASTSTIDGAHNVTLPVVEHMLSGALSVTLFSRQIIDFLKTSTLGADY